MRKNNEGNNNSQKQNIETDGQELGSKNEIQTSSIQRVKNLKYSLMFLYFLAVIATVIIILFFVFNYS